MVGGRKNADAQYLSDFGGKSVGANDESKRKVLFPCHAKVIPGEPTMDGR